MVWRSLSWVQRRISTYNEKQISSILLNIIFSTKHGGFKFFTKKIFSPKICCRIWLLSEWRPPKKCGRALRYADIETRLACCKWMKMSYINFSMFKALRYQHVPEKWLLPACRALNVFYDAGFHVCNRDFLDATYNIFLRYQRHPLFHKIEGFEFLRKQWSLNVLKTDGIKWKRRNKILSLHGCCSIWLCRVPSAPFLLIWVSNRQGMSFYFRHVWHHLTNVQTIIFHKVGRYL